MHKYIVALGGNLGDRAQNLERGIGLIHERLGAIEARSTWHETLPLNPPDQPNLVQPNFLNGVVIVTSTLEPTDFLAALLKIESELGRVREAGTRWQPRTIDLDIIAVDELVIDIPSLIVPHPEMHKRNFVLKPLAEVAPGWKHPVLGKTAHELLQTLPVGEGLPTLTSSTSNLRSSGGGRKTPTYER